MMSYNRKTLTTIGKNMKTNINQTSFTAELPGAPDTHIIHEYGDTWRDSFIEGEVSIIEGPENDHNNLNNYYFSGPYDTSELVHSLMDSGPSEKEVTDAESEKEATVAVSEKEVTDPNTDNKPTKTIANKNLILGLVATTTLASAATIAYFIEPISAAVLPALAIINKSAIAPMMALLGSSLGLQIGVIALFVSIIAITAYALRSSNNEPIAPKIDGTKQEVTSTKTLSNEAATKIQSVGRMYLAKKEVSKLKGDDNVKGDDTAGCFPIKFW